MVAVDVNGDDLIDIYVANDMTPNFLFLNNGDGSFKDVTDSAGAGYDENGLTHSGMGIDAEDLNGDGKPELLVTNFANESNSLYQNQGGGFFSEISTYMGMSADSMPWVKWGCSLSDFDSDGWPDCVVTDGHVDDNRREVGQSIDYKEPPILMRNSEGRRFRLATRDVGPYFASNHVGRGLAVGDIDNDGRIDIVIAHKDDRPAILLNRTRSKNHWIKLWLVGVKSNRDAIGAKLEVSVVNPDKDKPPLPGVDTSPERTIYRQRKGGSSMLSAHDPKMIVGVGPAVQILKLRIRWPSGQVSELQRLGVDQAYKIVEGEAEPTALRETRVQFIEGESGTEAAVKK